MYEKLGIVINFFIVFDVYLCLGDSILHKVYEESVNIPCETNLDCGFYEECNADYFCQCRPDENCPNNILINSIVTTKIGETCQTDSDCNIQDAFCEGTERKCNCSEGFVVSASGKLCLKAVHSLTDPCIEDIQCNTNIEHSICLQTICLCTYGMHDYNNTCIEDKALGDSCHTSSECITPYSECSNNKCCCARRYIASKDKQHCLLAANSLLSPCKENEQCVATLGGGSHCYNDLCNCMYMYQFKASAKKCVRDMTLGEVCSTHFDCHQPGSDPSRLICYLNECQCKTPMFVQEGVNCVEPSSAVKAVQNSAVLIFIIIFIGKVLIFIH